jgi:hypothetical protein
MNFFKKLWKKAKPLRKVGKVVAIAYAERKIEKQLEKKLGTSLADLINRDREE